MILMQVVCNEKHCPINSDGEYLDMCLPSSFFGFRIFHSKFYYLKYFFLIHKHLGQEKTLNIIVTGEMQLKIPMRYYSTPIRMAIIKKTYNTKYRERM